jgi:hypothetical protein
VAVRVISAMADNVVPIEARGSGRTDDFNTDDAYPSHWLPEVHDERSPVTVGND